MKVNLVRSRIGSVGEEMLIYPNIFARKIAVPENIDNSILYRDLSFTRSSINPIIAANKTVSRKIEISLKKVGKIPLTILM